MAIISTADAATISGFGDEWMAFDQQALSDDELDRRFREYFDVFPLDRLGDAEGFDLGCGSGRWARLLAPRVGLLTCIDPSPDALEVARRNLSGHANVELRHGCADSIPLADGSQDFGISLGVLHHTRDPRTALVNAAAKLKPGAPFLAYLYYNFENRQAWFRAIWRVTDLVRRAVSRAPFVVKRAAADVIAATVYLPLARCALLAEQLGFNVSNVPLSSYRDWSFYSMRTDALDRFGTRIEHRFSRADIRAMMERAGLTDVQFSPHAPYWVACGYKGQITRELPAGPRSWGRHAA